MELLECGGILYYITLHYTMPSITQVPASVKGQDSQTLVISLLQKALVRANGSCFKIRSYSETSVFEHSQNAIHSQTCFLSQKKEQEDHNSVCYCQSGPRLYRMGIKQIVVLTQNWGRRKLRNGGKEKSTCKSVQPGGCRRPQLKGCEG